jgi:hypothetical protein
LDYSKRRLISAFALLPWVAMQAGCSSLVQAPVSGGLRAADFSEMLVLWGEILNEHVDTEGRVNFRAVAANPFKLERVIRFIEAESPMSHPEKYSTKALKLAYHINAYNALSLHAVIQAGIPRELDLLARLRFFKLNKSEIAGGAMSLFDYENLVIRQLNEPRIHFALNCMSVGCPRLPRVVFSAATMDTQLEAETYRFFSETRNLRVDAASKTVFYSEILKFYTSDFLAVAPSLAAYASKYARKSIPADYATQFTPYDWHINAWPSR